MQKKHWLDSIGTGIGLFVAILGSAKFGYPYLFWFIGGVIMGISGLLFLVDKEKTNKALSYAMPVLTGLAVTMAYYLTDLIGLQ